MLLAPALLTPLCTAYDYSEQQDECIDQAGEPVAAFWQQVSARSAMQQRDAAGQLE